MAIVININSGKDFEPVSEGVHAGVLAAVVDKGVVPTAFGDKEKVMLVWLTDEADENGKTKLLFKSYTKSLHEKSQLRKDLKGIRGKDLSEAEITAGNFNIEEVIGAQNQLVVQHTEAANGKVYANIQAIMKAKAGARVAIPADFEFKPKAKEDNFSAAHAKSMVGVNPVKAAGGGRAVAAAAYRPAAPAATITDDDIPF